MKGRPPILNIPEEAITFYTSIYYRECEKNAELRFDVNKHIDVISQINTEYQKSLRKNNFNYNKYENCFIECIDFLTKVFTKKKDQEARAEAKKKLFKR